MLIESRISALFNLEVPERSVTPMVTLFENTIAPGNGSREVSSKMRTFNVCAESEVARIVKRRIRQNRMLRRYKDASKILRKMMLKMQARFFKRCVTRCKQDFSKDAFGK